MTKDRKRQQAKRYLEQFNELIQTTQIFDRNTNNIYTPHTDEVFKQAWKDNKARRYYPTKWFISNYGNLISIVDGQLVMLIKRMNGKNEDGYFYVEFKKPRDRYNSKAFIHIMVALVFNVQSYGRAKKLIQSKGLSAFGIYHQDKRKKYTVQCHHKNENKWDNRAKNLELLTAEIHNDVLHRISSKSTNEQVAAYSNKVVNEAIQEPPFAILIMTGEGYDGTGKPVKTDKCIYTLNASDIQFSGDNEVNMVFTGIK